MSENQVPENQRQLQNPQEFENQRTEISRDENTKSLEEIFKEVVGKGYAAILKGVIFFILYIFIGQINSFFNYSKLINTSTVSSFSTTNSILNQGRGGSGDSQARKQNIKKSQEAIIKKFSHNFKETFNSNNRVQALYCIDEDGYMQSLTAYNDNTKVLFEKLKRNISTQTPTQASLETATTSLLLMAYEACGDITTNIYVADMGTIRGSKVNTSILNISIPFTSEQKSLVTKAYYYLKNTNNFQVNETYPGRLLDLENDLKDKVLSINTKNILLEIPCDILSISRQTISTKYLSPNLKVSGLNIFGYEFFTWVGVLGFFGGLKYALSALLYSFPLTSFIFLNYIALIVFLIYTGLLLVMIEFFPALVFLYKNKKVREGILNSFDIVIKFCYNVVMVLIFITILTSMILPLILIFF